MISIQHPKIKADIMQKTFSSFPTDVTLLLSLIKLHLKIHVVDRRLKDFDVVLDP